MLLINQIIITLFIIIIINLLLNHCNFLIDNKTLSYHKRGMNLKDKIPLSGGIIFVLTNLIFNYPLSSIYVFLVLIFVVGIFSDLNIFNSPFWRIVFQSLIILVLLIFFQESVTYTNIFFIDYLLKYKFISIFFTLFCLVVLINGFNLLDGLNSLVIGYNLIVILAILFVSHNYNLSVDTNLLKNILIILLLLFILNLFEINFLGDSGSYSIGFMTGIICINFSMNNIAVSPIFIVLMLWYPCMENLFSIIRRRIKKTPTYKPDKNHLHHLIYDYLKKKIKFKKYFNNSLCSLLINLFNTFILFLGTYYFNNSTILGIIVIFNVIIYISFYLILYKKFKIP